MRDAVRYIAYRSHHDMFKTGTSGRILGIFGVVTCSAEQIFPFECELSQAGNMWNSSSVG